MLALLLLLHHASAKDTSQTTHVVEKVHSCPEVGYYFKRDLSPNMVLPVCQLCFCQDNGTAVCWPRETARCDPKHYHHYGRKKRERPRRSPGLSDIFFRDAARDVFNKNLPEECKPFESSFSEGCPPADWCIGCTICDCDANGRWDCHVLSFCSDDKGKKKMNKRRNAHRAKVMKRQLTKKKPSPKTTKKPDKKSPPKKNTKQIKGKRPKPKQNKPQQVKRNPINNRRKIPIKQGNKGKVKKPVKKSKPQIQKKKPLPKNKGKFNNKKVIKKPDKINVKQITKAKSKTLNANDDVMKNVANSILKKVMASVEKIVSDKTQDYKKLQKRSMPCQKKNNNKNGKKNNNASKLKNIKKTQSKARSKREIPVIHYAKNYTQKVYPTPQINIFRTIEPDVTLYQTLGNDIVSVTSDTIAKAKLNYFKYQVDSGKHIIHDSKNVTIIRKGHIITPALTINDSRKMDLKPKDFKLNAANKSSCINEVNITKGEENEELQETVSNIHYFNDILKSNVTCGKIKKNKRLVGIENINTTNHFSNNNEKKFNFVKYLKKVYRTVFQKTSRKNKNVMKTIKQPFHKRKLIKIICKNFGSCKVDQTNKLLSSKLDQLKAESNTILKTAAIIKGLFKLLNIDDEFKSDSAVTNKFYSCNYLKKINAIMKGDFEALKLYNLTDTQFSLLIYIKQNSKMFIQSLENFARILNNIVQILSDHKVNHTSMSHKYLRKHTNQTTNELNTNDTVKEKLDKIIKLLLNYNLVQNRFMKQVYNVLKTLRHQKNSTYKYENITVSNKDKKNNDTIVIQNYTNHVIKNLRKVKNLALKLSSKNRRKRGITENDDIIEYLLILMEYLLKHNKPLNISPVNDGIDLLIEAIKSAPDITQSSKKKVLEYVHDDSETYTTETIRVLLNSGKVQGKVNINASSSFKDVKFRTFKPVEEDEADDLYLTKKKLANSNTVEIEGNHEKFDIKNQDIVNTSLSIGSANIPTYEKDNIVLDNIDTEKKIADRRYEVFFDDTDDEEEVDITTTKLPDVREETSPMPRYKPERTTAMITLKDEMYNDSYVLENKKIKLDWIDESYNHEEERKEVSRYVETSTQNSPSTTQMAQLATRTLRKIVKKDKYIDPISSVSRETVEEEKKDISKNINSEHVMYKKQMNLLNSLDYGTERSDIDADTKDDKLYNADTFPLYFV